jgi:arsenate reductase
MNQSTMYHNPRCSKSRQTLTLLNERGVEPEIVLYLDAAPTADELKILLEKLGMKARQLLRTKEAAYRELGLDDPDKTDAELLEAMHQHPILIERPIVVIGNRATIGRPPENVLDLL